MMFEPRDEFDKIPAEECAYRTENRKCLIEADGICSHEIMCKKGDLPEDMSIWPELQEDDSRKGVMK